MEERNNPINCLIPDIIESFASTSALLASRLIKLVETGKLSEHVNIYHALGPLKTPFIEPTKGLIKLSDSYLCYLWCSIYTFFDLIYAGIDRMSEEPKDNQVEEIDTTTKLFNWALSLKQSYSDWPAGLPVPDDGSTKSEMTNRVFRNSVRYVMYHEVAHIANNHNVYIDLIRNTNRSEAESTLLKELEIEADNYAFECLINPLDDEQSNLTKILGSAMALLSSLNLLSTTKDLNALRHPDMDVRIFNLMNKHQFQHEHYKLCINMLYNVGLTLFLNIYNVKYDRSDLHFDSFDSILNYLYECVDVEKKRVS